MYAKIKDGAVIEYPYDFESLQSDNPFTNYGYVEDIAVVFPDTEQATIHGCVLVNVVPDTRPAESVMQSIAPGGIELIDGVWTSLWVITDLPFEPIKQAYFDTVRASRETILNRLAGIGFASIEAGDTALSADVAKARLALLDITEASNVLAATNAESLKSAFDTAYQEIIAAAPEVVRTAFRTVDL